MLRFLKGSKKADKITLFVIIAALMYASIFHLVKNKNVADNRTQTVGKISDFRHINKSSYSIEYLYEVNGKRYMGKVGSSYFNCTRENKCIGYEIDVLYSSENPKYSQVDLRKYEEFKTSVYLIE